MLGQVAYYLYVMCARVCAYKISAKNKYTKILVEFGSAHCSLLTLVLIKSSNNIICLL